MQNEIKTGDVFGLAVPAPVFSIPSFSIRFALLLAFFFSFGFITSVSIAGAQPPTSTKRADTMSLSPLVHLEISAEIDGSDRVVVTHQGARWEHLSWDLPTNVRVNGLKWKLTESFILKNSGETEFLSPDVDFSRARIVSRHGRDVIAMETYRDKIIVYFGDNPLGDAPYDIDIAFDNR